jgi:hypothetical protein
MTSDFDPLDDSPHYKDFPEFFFPRPGVDIHSFRPFDEGERDASLQNLSLLAEDLFYQRLVPFRQYDVGKVWSEALITEDSDLVFTKTPTAETVDSGDSWMVERVDKSTPLHDCELSLTDFAGPFPSLKEAIIHTGVLLLEKKAEDDLAWQYRFYPGSPESNVPDSWIDESGIVFSRDPHPDNSPDQNRQRFEASISDFGAEALLSPVVPMLRDDGSFSGSYETANHRIQFHPCFDEPTASTAIEAIPLQSHHDVPRWKTVHIPTRDEDLHVVLDYENAVESPDRNSSITCAILDAGSQRIRHDAATFIQKRELASTKFLEKYYPEEHGLAYRSLPGGHSVLRDVNRDVGSR